MTATAGLSLPPRTLFEPEHDDYRESFRRFIAAEVTPHVEAWEQAGVVSRDLFKKAAAHGFMCMAIPEEYGGNGVDDYLFNVVLMEEAGRSGASSALAGPLLNTDVCLPYILSAATDEQKQRWLPSIASGDTVMAIAMTEPGTGSDLNGIRTRAKRDGDKYVVNGAKTFITNGINADLVIVAAKTDPDAGHAGMSLLVVERGMPGFERGRHIEKLGQHASDTAELFFDDVEVPAENLLGEEGSGFMQLLQKLVPERLTIAIGGQVGAETALEMTLDYVRERKAFGRPIGTFQSSRFAMAEMRTEVEVSRAFIDRCIERHCRGQLSIEEAAMAKWWTTEMMGRVVDRCVQLHGGYGYTTEYPIAKAWADARITRIYGGTTEIMKELIGRSMGLGG